MSNEYKEWEKDRKEEAWIAINKISEIFENAGEETFYQGYFRDKWYEIKNILEKYWWED